MLLPRSFAQFSDIIGLHIFKSPHDANGQSGLRTTSLDSWSPDGSINCYLL